MLSLTVAQDIGHNVLQLAYQLLRLFDVDETPVARRIAKRVLTLPLYADLALEDVDRICDIVLAQKV